MGTIYQVECSCGYLSPELFWGSGWAGDAYGRKLARCAHCQITVTTPAASKRPRCPECRRKLEIIELDEDMQEPVTLVSAVRASWYSAASRRGVGLVEIIEATKPKG